MQSFRKIISIPLIAAFTLSPLTTLAMANTAFKKNLANDQAIHQPFAPAINQLINETNSAYTASLPLLASSVLGDHALYITSLTNMLRSLHNLNENPLPADKDTNQWMENNAFKAWMWGRVLLAADNMNDTPHIEEAKQRLLSYLNSPRTSDDNAAFITWSRAYLAGLNTKTYAAQKGKMLAESIALSETYTQTKKHDDLSNALWAWVMDNQAASLNHDKATYEQTLNEISKLMNGASVVDALNAGLTRTTASNDYPAWAMAIIDLSATRMKDIELTTALSAPLEASINAAKNSNQMAEWTLASLDTILARTNQPGH